VAVPLLLTSTGGLGGVLPPTPFTLGDLGLFNELLLLLLLLLLCGFFFVALLLPSAFAPVAVPVPLVPLVVLLVFVLVGDADFDAGLLLRDDGAAVVVGIGGVGRGELLVAVVAPPCPWVLFTWGEAGALMVISAALSWARVSSPIPMPVRCASLSTSPAFLSTSCTATYGTLWLPELLFAPTWLEVYGIVGESHRRVRCQSKSRVEMTASG